MEKKTMAREENTPQDLIQEWLDKGNEIEVCPPMTRTDPEDITHMFKRRTADVGSQ